MTSLGKGQAGENQLFWVADNVIANDFPDVNSALRDPDGLLAIGGVLGKDRLLEAYRKGIFPWYSEGQPVLWWSPNPRCVLEPNDFKISRSLAKTLRNKPYRVSFNQSFADVVMACSQPRKGSSDTWITPEMLNAYTELHQSGYGLSVETWLDDTLVGGLYGVVIGKVFFGESMFSRKVDASKVALTHLVKELRQRDFRLIDCQVHSKHLQTLGATPIPRDLFVNILKHYCTPEINYDWPVISKYS